MITFKDICLENQNYMFFVPGSLSGAMIHIMRQEKIPYTHTKWRQVDREKYAQKIADAKAFFETHNCPWNCTAMEIISCPIKPDIMMGKSLSFFGDTIDPDYKKIWEGII